jgi:hypothetical protein
MRNEEILALSCNFWAEFWKKSENCSRRSLRRSRTIYPFVIVEGVYPLSVIHLQLHKIKLNSTVVIEELDDSLVWNYAERVDGPWVVII